MKRRDQMMPILPLPRKKECEKSEYQKEIAHFGALKKAKPIKPFQRLRLFFAAHVFVKRR